MISDDKAIGVLGGIGPWATVDFFRKLLDQVPAERDQDYPRIIINCNSKIPSRVEAVAGTGKSPVTALRETARALERAGASLILLGSCGTHIYYQQICEAVNIPILNVISILQNYLLREFPNMRCAGLLAADFTIEKDLFGSVVPNNGDLVVPQKKFQKKVISAINHVKRGNIDTARNLFIQAAEAMVSGQKAEAIIFGCTEVPAAVSKDDISVKCIDTTELVTREALILTGSLVSSSGMVETPRL